MEWRGGGHQRTCEKILRKWRESGVSQQHNVKKHRTKRRPLWNTTLELVSRRITVPSLDNHWTALQVRGKPGQSSTRDASRVQFPSQELVIDRVEGSGNVQGDDTHRHTRVKPFPPVTDNSVYSRLSWMKFTICRLERMRPIDQKARQKQCAQSTCWWS